MAKIVQVNKPGGPEVLEVVDVEVADPGPDEVRVRVAAFGLNRAETYFRMGAFGTTNWPVKIGYEAAGTVEAIGSGVTQLAVGDRVATIPGQSMEEYGTHGEVILYPAKDLVKMPEQQPMDEAAATWMQYLTAYGLIGIGNLSPGDTVVITAASSSVGLAAIDIVNASGGSAIAVTRGESKAEALKRHGAGHIIVSDKQNVAETVMSITERRGAKIVFDAVGGEGLTELLTAVSPGGIVIVYGALGGDSAQFPIQLAMGYNLTLRGYSMNFLMADPAMRTKAIDYINGGLSSGQFRPVIDSKFPMDRIVDAHRQLESNTQFGKVLVQVA